MKMALRRAWTKNITDGSTTIFNAITPNVQFPSLETHENNPPPPAPHPPKSRENVVVENVEF